MLPSRTMAVLPPGHVVSLLKQWPDISLKPLSPESFSCNSTTDAPRGIAAAALETASPPRATGPSTSQPSMVPSRLTSTVAMIGCPSGATLAASPAVPQGSVLGASVVVVSPGTVVVVSPGTVVSVVAVSVDPAATVVLVVVVDVVVVVVPVPSSSGFTHRPLNAGSSAWVYVLSGRFVGSVWAEHVGRNCNFAVRPTTSMACCASFTPGSDTTMKLP